MDKTAKIRQLNDALRMTLQDRYGSRVVITRAVVNEAPDLAKVYLAVRTFDTFDKDNDPYEEHDFGSFTCDGLDYFWKIDYYDKDLQYGSEDPSDPQKTTRVLTIMLASDY